MDDYLLDCMLVCIDVSVIIENWSVKIELCYRAHK